MVPMIKETLIFFAIIVGIWVVIGLLQMLCYFIFVYLIGDVQNSSDVHMLNLAGIEIDLG